MCMHFMCAFAYQCVYKGMCACTVFACVCAHVCICIIIKVQCVCMSLCVCVCMCAHPREYFNIYAVVLYASYPVLEHSFSVTKPEFNKLNRIDGQQTVSNFPEL